MGSFLSGAAYSFLFLCLLLAIECITRLKKFPKEITRRVAHVLSGLFGAAMAFILEPWVFITFVLFFLLIISISYLRKFFSSIHGVRRKTYGEILLPLGILVAYLIADGATTGYLVAVLILAISDSFAGIAGDLKFVDRKRIAGSFIFFITAFAIIIFFFKGQQLPLLFTIALVITFIERISNYGIDNVSIPLAASLLLKILL